MLAVWLSATPNLVKYFGIIALEDIPLLEAILEIARDSMFKGNGSSYLSPHPNSQSLGGGRELRFC